MLRRLLGRVTFVSQPVTLLSFVFAFGFVPHHALAQAPMRIATGGGFTLIVSPEGSVWSYGDNANGALGIGSTTNATTPQLIPGLSNVQVVATGYSHALALTASGALYGWGDNTKRQLGDGTTVDRTSPILINLSNVVAIAGGGSHSVALTSNGDVFTWGDNYLGQLGTADTDPRSTPVLVLSGVVAIGAGFNHTVVVKADGTAWAWGYNGQGQLGIGVAGPGANPTPLQMIGVSDAAAIAGGNAHTVIRRGDGTLLAVGSNAYGEVGDNSSIQRTTAVPVVGLTNIQHVAVGYHHNLALDNSGVVWVWGKGSDGQLGIGIQTNLTVAQPLATLSDLEWIAAGGSHSSAIDANGVVSTWGDNYYGQLGDGTTTDRWSPGAISGSGYDWFVGTPTFSVVPGTYSTPQSVIVRDATPSAEIHYSINGSEPTPSDPIVASGGTVSIDVSTILKAKAWKIGMPTSAVQSAQYTLQVVMPSVSVSPPSSGPYSLPQNVVMATTTSGAAIRYTTDGTDPTGSSTLYTNPVTINATTTFKSAGFKTGWTTSTVNTTTITFNYGPLEAPTVEPASGSYAGGVSVTMSSPTSGAVIRYTTNNTAPSSSSTAYSGPVPVTQTTTVRAKAFHSSYTTSPETSRTYTIAAATPTLSVASGSYAPGSIVTISTTEATATLRMTLDGTDPTSTSPVVASGTTLLIGNYTLRVRAFRSNVLDSAVAIGAYTLTGALGRGAVTTGGAHTIVATPDGRVYAWGDNGNGQLGRGNTTDQTTPQLLNTIAGVTSVSGGLTHTLALRADGQLYAFGSNANGRLGDGTTTQRTSPVPVSALSNIIAIAAGDTHSLALRGDGRVFAWGANASGQLGLGDSGAGTDRSVPTEIPTLSNVAAIAAGDTDSFAVTADGQLYAWGANGNARLGIGTAPSIQSTPALVALSNVVTVAAGQAHTLAMTGAGRVYGWGANSNGQVGVAPATTVSTPTLIPNLQVSAIAAGDNHSGAIRADGAIVLWGTSGSGQVGNNSTASTNSVPTVISGPSGVSTVSLGDLHSIAITASGEVWAWGESLDGRLGNGTTTPDRLTPQAMLTGLTNWPPAAPTIDVPSGSLGAPQVVTLTSSTAGAVIRYTQNGTVPTDSDAEVPANGQIEIAYSSFLRARAFVTGRPPSAPGRAEYEFQSAAPVITPATGTYGSAQTVTITVTGVPGEIRYTLDGTEPTTTSALYSQAFVVSTATTVKAKTFPSNGWSASPSASAMLAFNYGTLDPPGASPAGGVFATAQEVTLSAAAGATIRYTLDGSTPTGASPLYTGPFAVADGQTVKSMAFHPDWTASSVRADTYTVDTVPPIISGSSFPAAIGGWHSLATTVSFNCTDNVGIATCSTPSAFTTEGPGQTITGTAVDLAGRETTTSVTINIDLTPPDVTLTSPVSLSTTTDTSIALVGEVSDQLSGLASVTCNDVTATVVGGEVSCNVPLDRGINDIVIAARDVAGNSRSAGVRVVRAGTSNVLGLAPAMQTLRVNETSILKLTDDFGTSIAGATWESSDTDVVSLSDDDPPVLTAVGDGSATITVTKNALTTAATVVVVAGPLASATTRWAINGLFGNVVGSLPANRVDLTVPDIFAIEPGATGTIVRGVTSGGDVQWVAQSPGYPVMADSFGGIVAGLPAASSTAYWGDPSESRFGGFARFAGPPNIAPWRYYSVGRTERPAQAQDGTIYAIEKYETGSTDVHGASIVETQVIVLDGATGGVRSKTPLAREILGSACGNEDWVVVPKTIGPVVGHDGFGYLLVRNVTNARSGGCGMSGVVSQDIGVKLLRISPAGAVASTPIYSQHCERGFSNYTTCMNPPNLAELVPDGIGGVLVAAGYTITAINDHTFTMEGRLARVTPEGIQYDIPADFSEISLTDGAGRAYVTDPSGVRAVNVSDWTTAWSVANPSLRPATALLDNHVTMFDVTTNNVTEYAADGTAGQSAASDWYWGYLGNQSAFGLSTGVVGGTGGQLSSHISLPLNEANGSFVDRGVGTQQNAPRRRPRLDTVPDAALAAFDFFQLHVRSTPWEWGGVICPQNGRFTFSRIVTDNSNGAVRTIAEPDMTAEQIAALPSCGLDGPMAPVGAFHFHTMDIAGQPYPSGYGPSPGTPNDLNTAALRPELTFFVQTRAEGDASYIRTSRYMYQAQQVGTDSNGNPNWNAYYNTFKWVNRQWVRFDPPVQ